MSDIEIERLEQLLMQHRTKDWSKVELADRLKADEDLAQEIVKLFALHFVVGQSEQLKALEDLKDFAYDNCQPHNSDRLSEIMERL